MGEVDGGGHGVSFPLCGRCGHLMTRDGRCLLCSKRILVTGGLGFIGSEIVLRLRDEGHEVVVLDGLTYAGQVDRLTELGISTKEVTVLWHDLRSPISEYLDHQIGPIDAVINSAAGTHVDRSITDPKDFFLNNSLIALNMLEWARARAHSGRSLEAFIQISTDEVYGPAKDDGFHSEWEAIIPSNPYSASKAAQEAAAIAYWRTFDVPVVITNTMNNIGPRQHPEKFLPKAIRHLMQRQPVPVHAKREGSAWIPSSRCWLDTKVHADALAFLLHRVPAHYPEADRPDRWHIVGEEFDCARMVEAVASFMGVEPMIEFVDFHTSRPGHDLRYALSGEKFYQTGWIPPITFMDALNKTVNWYLENPRWLHI